MRQAEAVSDERVVAVWRDGAAVAVPPDEPVLSAFDLGLVRGDGVFETVAVIGGGTPHLDAHLTRLARSAALLELADPGGRPGARSSTRCSTTGRPTSRAPAG